MRSVRGFAGAVVLLLGVPAAIATAALGGSAEVAIHLALGVSFLLLASAAFDFRTTRLISPIACVAIGALGAIFLLQGVSDSMQSAELRRIAYDVLGQRLEKALGYVFLAWCVAILVMNSTGWRRGLGAAALAAVLGAEVYGFIAPPAPEALKLTYLGVFVWLAIEAARSRA
jgi:hypothetical protein